ncbi:MAG: DUF5615 family PIN-like protein [Bacteroidota bacterium]
MTFLLDHDAPDDLIYSLEALGHQGITLRSVLPIDANDEAALRYAVEHQHIMITCNRDDYLELAKTIDHCGMIILIRRKTRTAERAALVQLLDKAGEAGITGNINFA